MQHGWVWRNLDEVRCVGPKGTDTADYCIHFTTHAPLDYSRLLYTLHNAFSSLDYSRLPYTLHNTFSSLDYGRFLYKLHNALSSLDCIQLMVGVWEWLNKKKKTNFGLRQDWNNNCLGTKMLSWSNVGQNKLAFTQGRCMFTLSVPRNTRCVIDWLGQVVPNSACCLPFHISSE